MCTNLHIFNWKKLLSVEKFYTDAAGSVGDVWPCILWWSEIADAGNLLSLDISGIESVHLAGIVQLKKNPFFNFSSKPRQIKLSSCPSFDVVKDLRCIFACSWWHSQRKMQIAGRRGCNEPISSLSYSDDIHCRLHAYTHTLNTLTFTTVLPVSPALTCSFNYKLSMAIKSKLPQAKLHTVLKTAIK